MARRDDDDETDETSQTPDPEPGGGVTIGGSMAGGAIATGRDSTARHVGPAGELPPDGGAAVPRPVPPAGPGGVSIGGSVTGGALATGHGSEATHDASAPDAVHRQLLDEVTLLRGELGLLAARPDVMRADDELAAVQDEINRTGRADRGRLQRLRAMLTGTGAAVAVLASAATVAQTIQGMVG